MRKLYFTTGSPFARAVRIVLAEKGLSFERDETYTTPSVERRARSTPTLQVPALEDGDVRLWDSTVILEYLMTTYPNSPAPPGQPLFATDYVRDGQRWTDRLVHATLRTFGGSVATISQMQWSGIRHEDNAYGTRCAIRLQHLLDWFETQIVSAQDGFVPGVASVQDVLLTAWCQFIERRPLRLDWRSPNRPKVAALVERLPRRPSFDAAPALWWEPGGTYEDRAEVAWAAKKTNFAGPDFADWSQDRQQAAGRS